MRTVSVAIICLLAGFSVLAAVDAVIARDVILTPATFDEVAGRVIESPEARPQLGKELLAQWLIMDMERVDAVHAFGPDGMDLISEIAAATTETEEFRVTYFEAIADLQEIGLDGEGTVVVDLASALQAANDGSLSPRAQLLAQEIDGLPMEAEYTFTRDPGPTTRQLLRNATIVLSILLAVFWALANRLLRDPLIAMRKILWCATGLLGAQLMTVPILGDLFLADAEPIETILAEVVVSKVARSSLLATVISAALLATTVMVGRRRRTKTARIHDIPVVAATIPKSLIEV